ncbi:MAG: FkbM family methyltransferase [Aulosira sp. DedQUE10]|nr:FkbM family methyltransferase [Aulosira sp. DedQUE10]
MNIYSVKSYSTLLSIRPAQLGNLIKQILRIQRQYIKTKGNHIFWADPVSVFGLELLTQGVYELQMTKLLQLVLHPSDIFVDLGGNEGYFSVIASSLVKDGKVHCIEPQSRLQPILQENIKINNANAVKVHRVAISSNQGEVTLFLRPSTNTGASSLFRHWKIGSVKETVPSITLDEFFKENSLNHVRLLKVDCEGAESLVFAGGHNVIQQNLIQLIAMEYHPSICGVEKCIDIHNQLRSAGYVLTKVREQCIYHLPGLEKEIQSLGELSVNCNWND